MKYLIGIVGENGAGKGAVSSIIKGIGGSKVTILKFSDILFETLKLWDLPATRKNLQDLAIIMDAQYGKGTLTHAGSVYIKKQAADIIIIEGIRWTSDVAMIRSFKNSFIIYVTAKPKIRYERMKSRGEKVGEENKTFKQFLKEEKARTETEIKKIGKSADFKVKNNKGVDELKAQIKKIYKKMIT